ncbi:MAG: AraC family transcriptional regulator [Deltaproteobacteria bacterium]|nr:AraC family transcriptional regulator [Deltaproteobacteria bacterium]
MRDLVSTMILLGALQGAVLALVLWARRANRLANRILAALVLVVAMMLLSRFVEQRWAFDGHPHLLGLAAPLPFLTSPLLYLYAVSLTRPVTTPDARWLAHGLPCVAFVLYMLQVFYLKTGPEKLALAHTADTNATPLSFDLVGVAGIVQAFTYLFLTWRALERYGKKMHGYFSDLTRIDLRWLKVLVFTHVGVWSAVAASTLLRMLGSAWGGVGALVPLGSTLAIFVTAYVSLWQPELTEKATAAKIADEEDSTPPPAPPLPEPPPAAVSPAEAEAPAPASPPSPKYQRNRLDDAEAEAIVRKLETLMKAEELFRDPALTLPTLAEAVGVTPHMLSQVLNVRVGKSFFVYVNTFRAEALMTLLADPARSGRTVLELAFEVGFNSKSTLNSFFKKHTGTTPTAFRASKTPATSKG